MTNATGLQLNCSLLLLLLLKDCLTRSTLSSDTRVRPALFPLQSHPVVWNCWCQRLMLLADGGSLSNCRRNARWTETTDSCFTNCSKQNAFRSAVAIIALLRHRQREKREWDCACAQNLSTCCFFPCGKLTSVCVLIAVMTDWNCSNNFDTPYIKRRNRFLQNLPKRLHDVLSKTVTLTLSYFTTPWRCKASQHYYLPLALIFAEICLAHAVFLHIYVLQLIIWNTTFSPFPCRTTALNYCLNNGEICDLWGIGPNL